MCMCVCMWEYGKKALLLCHSSTVLEFKRDGSLEPGRTSRRVHGGLAFVAPPPPPIITGDAVAPLTSDRSDFSFF